jgi:hypothetical protein
VGVTGLADLPPGSQLSASAAGNTAQPLVSHFSDSTTAMASQPPSGVPSIQPGPSAVKNAQGAADQSRLSAGTPGLATGLYDSSSSSLQPSSGVSSMQPGPSAAEKEKAQWSLLHRDSLQLARGQQAPVTSRSKGSRAIREKLPCLLIHGSPRSFNNRRDHQQQWLERKFRR